MLKYSNISSGESSIPDYMQRQSSVGMTKSCLIFNIKWKNICCSIQRTLATVINLNRLCCTEFTSNSKISGTQKKNHTYFCLHYVSINVLHQQKLYEYCLDYMLSPKIHMLMPYFLYLKQ